MSIVKGTTRIKGTTRRTWLTEDSLNSLKIISSKTKLRQTELLSQIMDAGILSIVSNGWTFKLPLQFQIIKT